MLTPEENETLTRVGPGTVMGRFFRRFWIPALLSEELPAPDCPPIRTRLLGEDLVAFRDSEGKLGLLDAHCPHRRADLFFGRNEESGLRCVYHGWKFDLTGACVDMPNEPAESNFKGKITTVAYPCREQGGVVWAYMGPKDHEPELPQLEWTLVPESHRYLTKQMLECNYLQVLEGDVDNSHASFLHAPAPRVKGEKARGAALASYMVEDTAPRVTINETDYGLQILFRRQAERDSFYWRVTQWLMPFYALIPSPPGSPYLCNQWVPRDDTSAWVIRAMCHPERPLSASELEEYRWGAGTFARLAPGSWRPLANRDNDYLIDRALQRSFSYTGVRGANEQDRAVTESQGNICDRSKEHLGTSDAGIIAVRRSLLREAMQLQEGIAHQAIGRGEVYRVRPVAAVVERDGPASDSAPDLSLSRW